jgi:YidC/Oxa1 family membrane protein insertase
VTNNLRNKSNEKPKNNKLLIALAISIVLLFLIDKYQQKINPTPAISQEVAAQNANPLVPNKDELFNSTAPVNLAKSKYLKPLHLKTNNYDVEIDLVGAKITNLELSKYFKEKDSKEPIQMFHKKEQNEKSGMIFDAGWLTDKFQAPENSTVWKVTGKTENSAILEYKTANLTYNRTFYFNDNQFITNIKDTVINNSNETVKLAHYSQIHHIGEREDRLANSFTNYTGPEALVDSQKVFADYSDLQDGDVIEAKGKNMWAAITQQYFANAIIPSNTQENIVKFKYNKVNGENFYTALVRTNVKELKAGDTLTNQYQVYSGPKSTKILEEQDVAKSVNLAAMLDYGWFHVIAKLFFDGIMLVNDEVGSLAISIIIITLILKIILFPLANKSYVSMAKMRNIQPEMKKLQEKYGKDRQAMGLEMMALYKKHKVNPASGCWPMLVQIPIFFAMYKVILQSFEFRQAELGFWIHDMSTKDPYFVLPIIMGATMILQQRMNPQPMDETQKMVMNVMPIAFTALFLFFPSGLVLYWLTNNVLSITQQAIIMKKYEKKTAKETA